MDPKRLSWRNEPKSEMLRVKISAISTTPHFPQKHYLAPNKFVDRFQEEIEQHGYVPSRNVTCVGVIAHKLGSYV